MAVLGGLTLSIRTRALATTFLTYRCRDCGRTFKTFSVLINCKDRDAGIVEVMKLGEFPPFGGPISARVAKLLGQMIWNCIGRGCEPEAHGLGIGAASYLRRIVDNQWKTLVDEIRDAAAKLGETDLTLYEAAK